MKTGFGFDGRGETGASSVDGVRFERGRVTDDRGERFEGRES